MHKYLSSVLLFALLAFGCSDSTQITAPDLTESISSSYESEEIAAKGGAQMSDRSEWEHLFSLTFNGDFTYYYDCVNDNQGEELAHYATYHYYHK